MASQEWKPGSFTKNFSWGDGPNGLLQLYENIKIGFADTLADVPRSVYRQRVKSHGRPDYIPINFFLFNKPVGRTDTLIADELVFQALGGPHSPRFDKLALFAFNFSHVGRWSGQRSGQRYPALWAQSYVKDRVAGERGWSTRRVTATDIERYVTADPRYHAETGRKLSTNLNYLYDVGRLSEMGGQRVERWWADALFLALDRLIEDRSLDGRATSDGQLAPILAASEFTSLSGPKSLEKDLAAKHLCRLFATCGGRSRFREERVRELVARLNKEGELRMANDDRPRGAVHPTNPKILKSIPWACAPLAHAAGFVVLDPEQMASFDEEAFVRDRQRAALAALREEGVVPEMKGEDVLRITRER